MNNLNRSVLYSIGLLVSLCGCSHNAKHKTSDTDSTKDSLVQLSPHFVLAGEDGSSGHADELLSGCGIHDPVKKGDHGDDQEGDEDRLLVTNGLHESGGSDILCGALGDALRGLGVFAVAHDDVMRAWF